MWMVRDEMGRLWYPALLPPRTLLPLPALPSPPRLTRAQPPCGVQTAVDCYTSSSEVGWSGPGWIDVRVALQYIVNESRLHLPAKSKQCLRGFANPFPREAPSSVQCRLWVRYELAGSIHTLVVDDEDEVDIC